MDKNSIIKSGIYGVLLCSMLLILYTGNVSTAYTDKPLLNCNCPPGFKLNENNECIAQNLYLQLIAVHFFQVSVENNSAKFFDNIEKM